MDDSQKAELRKLWDAWQTAKARYEALAMCNTAGQTPDTLFELDLAYRTAIREMMASEDVYLAAMRMSS
jgi:hypothetical protein